MSDVDYSRVISTAPKGEPYDYVKLWLTEHSTTDNAFVQVEKVLNPTNAAAGDISFQWGIGPFIVKGTVNLSTLDVYVELGVQVPILGYVKITSVHGSLKTGVTISFDVAVAKGSVTLYLKNGKEVWIKYDITVLGAKYSGDSKIFTLPI